MHVNSSDKRLTYQRGVISSLNGSWLNVPLYSPSTLTSKFDIKALTEPDFNLFCSILTAKILKNSSPEWEIEEFDPNAGIKDILEEHFDAPTEISDVPHKGAYPEVPLDSLLMVERISEDDPTSDPNYGANNPLLRKYMGNPNQEKSSNSKETPSKKASSKSGRKTTNE